MTVIFDRNIVDLAFGGKSGIASNILDGLNPNQLKAVEATEGPVRIMAGAGTGKTTVIIRRTANIISKGLAKPEQILAVTFTKKAAGEIRTRLASFVGSDIARRPTIGNFHAICAEMLRRHAHLVNLPTKFNVLDDDGQKDVIGELAHQLGFLSNKKDKFTVMRFLSRISSWKEDGYDKDQILAAKDLVAISTNLDPDDDHGFLIQAAQIFEAYQVELETRRWVDFADLVLHMVRIFRSHPQILAAEAGRFRYMLVDEFQDTSPVQNEWVTLMAKAHRNICVVGDTDQSIYEWRNARPDIMLNFPQTWTGCKTITIDTNYRSSQEILDIANIVVEPLRRKDGLEKLLRSTKHGVAPADLVRSYENGSEEAESIGDMVRSKIEAGERPSELAILCRSGMIITGIERALRERGIRYTVAGAMKFTDREEVKDAIAWLTLAVNPMDYVAFTRIAGKPSRGLGPQKITQIRSLMRENAWTLREAVSALAHAGPKAPKAYAETLALLDQIDAITANGTDAGEVLERVLVTSTYWDWRENNDKDPQRDVRLENLANMVEEASQYATATDFLQMLALQGASETAWMDDNVVISTVHAAKGLEFNTVFCPAMEEGVFPNARAERTSYGSDEERRLAHVAWTRARNELYISYAAWRMGSRSTGLPSHYLEEAGLLGRPRRPVAFGERVLRRRAF